MTCKVHTQADPISLKTDFPGFLLIPYIKHTVYILYFILSHLNNLIYSFFFKKMFPIYVGTKMHVSTIALRPLQAIHCSILCFITGDRFITQGCTFYQIFEIALVCCIVKSNTISSVSYVKSLFKRLPCCPNEFLSLYCTLNYRRGSF